jgi:hypothetical protein
MFEYPIWGLEKSIYINVLEGVFCVMLKDSIWTIYKTIWYHVGPTHSFIKILFYLIIHSVDFFVCL